MDQAGKYNVAIYMAGVERDGARDVSRSMEPVYSVVVGGAAQGPTGLSTQWILATSLSLALV